ncbi:hypothetical protein PVAG01_00154 [Phlyctema vagabunda]|uniref:NmrA-like domain-containing protein n=1 Tax=Phlyctema vagabunda TaxID=108571 RepID=A0ABR4PTH1_9HELO
MSKLLIVFGATGQQGGSVVRQVLHDSELSKQYTIRAITRDASTPKAQELKKSGVEIVEADLTKKSTLNTALKGGHTIFVMTAPSFGPGAKDSEITQGKTVADIAVEEGIKYMIFSTLPSCTRISNGKYTKVTAFDAKAEIQDYISTLPLKSAFFAPGSFMQNFQGVMIPRPTGSGDYIMTTHVSPKTELPLIDITGDTGKYIGAILAEPDKYEGKTFCASTEVLTMDEMAQTISRVSGKTVKYVQIPEEAYRKHLPGWADILIEMMLYQQDFGYYGPGTRDLVGWAAENARGRLSTFEEYLIANPLPLE